MKVAVWDTYVPREDGRIMHFDIIAPADVREEQKIYAFGKHYLQQKGRAGLRLTARECSFCHIEQATDAMLESIAEKGYYIIEMQHCE